MHGLLTRMVHLKLKDEALQPPRDSSGKIRTIETIEDLEDWVLSSEIAYYDRLISQTLSHNAELERAVLARYGGEHPPMGCY